MQPIVVSELARQAWTFILERRVELMRTSGLWFVLLLLLSAVVSLLMRNSAPVEPTELTMFPPGMGLLLLFKAAEGVVVAALSIAVHRQILLDEALPVTLPIDRRTIRYALRMLGIVLATLLPVLVISIITASLIGITPASLQLAAMPAMVAMLLITCRLHPVLPSAAIDLGTGFGKAWDMTRNNGIRLTLGTILLLAPVVVPTTLLLMVIGPRLDAIPIVHMLPQAIAIAADMLEAALLASYFSLTWRQLVDRKSAAANVFS